MTQYRKIKYLKYGTERLRLKTELNAAWDEIVQTGGIVNDRCFGSLADMRRTLQELRSKTPSKKRCLGDYFNNL
jgi:hypothetical protein